MCCHQLLPGSVDSLLRLRSQNLAYLMPFSHLLQIPTRYTYGKTICLMSLPLSTLSLLCIHHQQGKIDLCGLLELSWLTSEDVDFLVLQKHWLWPFQLHQLDSIDKNYCHTAVCDKRLSPTSDLIRGCGGTAILWKICLNATLLSNLNSDRICGVQLP